MTVEARKYLDDVQSLSTSIVSSFGYRIDAIRDDITSLFFLVVRSIACSNFLYREADICAGQLACHNKYHGTSHRTLEGSCKERYIENSRAAAHLPVAWALSRDQVMESPTFITPLSLSPFRLFSLFSFSLLFSSVEINLLPQWPHKRLSKHHTFFYITSDLHRDRGDTSATIFTETEPRYTSFFQVMSLATDLHIDRHHGATSH